MSGTWLRPCSDISYFFPWECPSAFSWLWCRRRTNSGSFLLRIAGVTYMKSPAQYVTDQQLDRLMDWVFDESSRPDVNGGAS